MSKQTAVEWLIEEIHKNIVFIPVPMQEKAKEMEKEQQEMAFNEALDQYSNRSFEQYYNETYKKIETK